MADYLADLILSAILAWPPVAGGLVGLVFGWLNFGDAGAAYGLIFGVASGVLISRRRLQQRDAEQRDRDKGVSSLARGASRSQNH